jgi:predicted nucleic acid-binding protein
MKSRRSMTTVLPDSSAWVELLQGTGGPVHVALRQLVRSDAEILVTEPVVMEVLAGARSERHATKLRTALLVYPLAKVFGLDDYEAAAAIRRACRAGGDTVRGTMDCLIAAVAIREGARVLHLDRDFDAIARHTELEVYSLGG